MRTASSYCMTSYNIHLKTAHQQTGTHIVTVGRPAKGRTERTSNERLYWITLIKILYSIYIFAYKFFVDHVFIPINFNVHRHKYTISCKQRSYCLYGHFASTNDAYCVSPTLYRWRHHILLSEFCGVNLRHAWFIERTPKNRHTQTHLMDSKC